MHVLKCSLETDPWAKILAFVHQWDPQILYAWGGELVKSWKEREKSLF